MILTNIEPRISGEQQAIIASNAFLRSAGLSAEVCGVSYWNGYRFLYIKGLGSVREHVLIAEHVLGRPLPEKAIVHHVNGDRQDNRKTNLVICEDQSYHRLLHRRMRLIALGADPDTENWCVRCKSAHPIGEFRARSDGRGYPSSYCIPCQRIVDAERSRRSYHNRNPEARNYPLRPVIA